MTITKTHDEMTVVELRRECGRLNIGASGWRATARQDALLLALQTGKGPETAAVAAPAATGGGALEAIIAAAIAPLLKTSISREEFDVLAESWVEQSETLAAQAARIASLEEKLANGEFEAKAKPGVTVAFASPISFRSIPGLCHRQLTQVLTWVAADAPLWLWGGAGCGKTHLARQVAEALDLPFTCVSVDPTLTVGKLLGFLSLADGKFVEGFLLKAWRDGGVVLLDEIDTGDPGILAACNALLANGHYTFPGIGEVPRHPNFRVIAGANTKGAGPVAGYTARNRLDAATLDRFAVVELLPDAGLELAMVCGVPSDSIPWKGNGPLPAATAGPVVERWVRWVHKARAAAPSVLISPRASALGAKALRAGVPVAEVAEALVFKLVNADTRKNITNAAGSL